jgi:hypothetical protein
MADDPFVEMRKAPPEAAPLKRYLRARVRKSSKSAALLVGKMIPKTCPTACVTTGTPVCRSPFQQQKQQEERVMYIGLGGLLILILILWLLGVI